jgi:hypothetical protein
VVRESPASGRLRQQLQDNRIVFKAREPRNEKGAVGTTTFVFPCRVRAWLVLAGDIDNGKFRLSTRNVGRFGITEHALEPDAVPEKVLDELVAFIPTDANRIGPLLLRASSKPTAPASGVTRLWVPPIFRVRWAPNGRVRGSRELAPRIRIERTTCPLGGGRSIH